MIYSQLWHNPKMITWPTPLPTLIDGNFMLRPWALDDAPRVHELCQDPLIQEYTTIPVPYELHHATAFVEAQQKSDDHTQISFAGVLDGEVVLSISLHSIAEFDHICELGYWLAPEARGAGLAAKAARMITDFGFAIGFRRISAIVLPENPASQKTLLNAGFELENVVRQGMTRRDGTQTDAVLFARFPSVTISD